MITLVIFTIAIICDCFAKKNFFFYYLIKTSFILMLTPLQKLDAIAFILSFKIRKLPPESLFGQVAQFKNRRLG